MPATSKLSYFTLLFLFALPTNLLAQESERKPLRALLIAGGCCHEYSRQQKAISEGIQSRANVRVDVYWTDNSTTAPVLPLYSKLNWAEDYDVIIHDECAASIKDPALISRIVQVHQKLPAVHLHCAMHSFRTKSDVWFKHLGLQSSSHGPQQPIDIRFVDDAHPITKTLSDWTTINEELYNNVKLLGAHPIAMGTQKIGGKNPRQEEAVVAWTNETQGARSFSTTIGHNSETVEDPRYLELITRGLLWACGSLTPEYLQPYEGANDVTFIDKNKFKAVEHSDLGDRPSDAILVKPTASTTQSGHPPYHAIDGNPDTRWCASGDGYPQWLQLEFERPTRLSDIEIVWEFAKAYQYVVEGSAGEGNWLTLLDHSESKDALSGFQKLTEHGLIRSIRVRGLSSSGGWCSIREVKLKGEGLGTPWPAEIDSDGKFVSMKADAYVNRGNIPPLIKKLTAEEEATILRDVKVADGFEATLFAAPPAVNYPVFVAASVDGTLFVSSDGNGSLGRDPGRGRVVRLRDLDGDGRVDETKVFCEIDSPRGLVWDRDRLYVMHPPNLSVFFDHDHDGVADEQKTLVKNLAFGYDRRPADHTTNGLSIGVDGWLYVAGGDFGFMDATGTDGRKLTHRGGGVIRVRPDGTGLEIYSTGTRNILEVAISPRMDLFARDNTNDGGGWDVRLHHFTGNDDHGYPRLYKNFNDECVQPLADYGGGSGCGAVYIDEPGFGRWNDAPFTADWGTGSLYRHSVSPQGATFREDSAPESFIKMSRPTDADVDGNSRVYCASWKGATFKWNGPDVGYIVCVRPKEFVPPPMPDFAKSSDQELATIMKSPSYRRRMEAQRELYRRGSDLRWELQERGAAARSPDRNFVASLQSDVSKAGAQNRIVALGHGDPVVVHTAIRCLAQSGDANLCFEALDSGTAPAAMVLRSLAMMHTPEVVDGLIQRQDGASQEKRRQILAALCRLHYVEGKWNGSSWGTRPDTRGPYYQPETWAESDKIAGVLRLAMEKASSEDAAFLIQTMHLNRIESDEALSRLLDLAELDQKLIPDAVAQLISVGQVPPRAMGLLKTAIGDQDTPAEIMPDVTAVLAKIGGREAAELMLDVMVRLEKSEKHKGERKTASRNFLKWRALDNSVSVFEATATGTDVSRAAWADAALIEIASRGNASPEARQLAEAAIGNGWSEPERAVRLIKAATFSKNHHLDDMIWQARESPTAKLAEAASEAVRVLKIKPMAPDTTARIGTLAVEDAIAAVIDASGEVTLGQRVFTRANCAACHTLSTKDVQKGPFLGNIAKTYKRAELIAAVLDPSRTIAQGFATNSFLLIDGSVVNGFVTKELSDRVTLRDQKGKEHVIVKDDIDERKTMKTSVMPDGLMNEYTAREVSSLIEYLQSLAK